jgi:predicted TIM-barrel fold metal-dependent hydrolase
MNPTTAPLDVPVVDADTHLSEPWDLWTSRAPSRYRDLVPRVVDRDGEKTWVVGTDTVLTPAWAVAVVDPAGTKHLGPEYIFETTVNDVSPGASQVEPRLAIMDEQGIWAQIVYPNTVGFGGHQLGGLADEELRTLSLRIYNDAMIEMQEQSGQRLFPMGVLPYWDLDQAIQEAQRLADAGIVGVNLSTDTHEQGLPDLGERHWDPLWDALEDLDLPLNFHIGASATQSNYFGTASWPSADMGRKLALGSVMLYITNARALGNLLYSGMLERHPRLTVVSVESGVGWLPFFLQSLDYQLVETAPHLQDELSMMPSEYFKRQCYACFWFEEELLLPAIEYLGRGRCLFETDFPHPTCLYPDPLQRALRTFEGADDELRRNVFGLNAIRAYGLPTSGIDRAPIDNVNG